MFPPPPKKSVDIATKKHWNRGLIPEDTEEQQLLSSASVSASTAPHHAGVGMGGGASASPVSYLFHLEKRRARDLPIRAHFARMNFESTGMVTTGTPAPPPPSTNALTSNTGNANMNNNGDEGRCYVVGDERLYAGPLSPLIAQEDLAMVPIEVLYQRVYEMNMQRLASGADIPRFVVFIPKSDFTFDHSLRGLYFSFILAICLKRILLVDWPDFEKSYAPPLDDMIWSKSDPVFSKLYDAGSKSFAKVEKTENFRLNNIFLTYSGQFIINNDRVSADRQIFQNRLYFEHLPPLFFGSNSRMRRLGMIMEFLLSRPTPLLLNKIKTIKAFTGLDKMDHIVAVHVPVPSSWLGRLPRPGESPKFGDPAAWGVLPGVIEKHWQCVRAFLAHFNFEPNKTAILFTTNRLVSGVLAKVEEELGAFGKIVNWEERPPPRTYTGDVDTFEQRRRQLQQYIDPNIVNGFILGEATASITAGTTYGIFHAARTNWAHPTYIVKVGGSHRVIAGTYYPVSDSNDYCGPMLRADKSLDVDIEF